MRPWRMAGKPCRETDCYAMARGRPSRLAPPPGTRSESSYRGRGRSGSLLRPPSLARRLDRRERGKEMRTGRPWRAPERLAVVRVRIPCPAGFSHRSLDSERAERGRGVLRKCVGADGEERGEEIGRREKSWYSSHFVELKPMHLTPPKAPPRTTKATKPRPCHEARRASQASRSVAEILNGGPPPARRPSPVNDVAV